MISHLLSQDHQTFQRQAFRKQCRLQQEADLIALHQQRILDDLAGLISILRIRAQQFEQLATALPSLTPTQTLDLQSLIAHATTRLF